MHPWHGECWATALWVRSQTVIFPPKARLAIKEILGDESIAMASNWADFIKAEPSYNYLSSWHYINFKDGLSEADMKTYLAADTIADAYTKINFLVTQLKDKKTEKAKKVMYLRLLIHIVGDVHQAHACKP